VPEVNSTVSRIVVISDGVEHEPYILFLSGQMQTEDGGTISITGAIREYQTVKGFFERLTEIQFADDFRVIIEGIYATTDVGRLRVNIYDEKHEGFIGGGQRNRRHYLFSAGRGIVSVEHYGEFARGGNYFTSGIYL